MTNNPVITKIVAITGMIIGTSLMCYSSVILSDLMPLPADCYNATRVMEKWHRHCDYQRQTTGVALVGILAGIFQTTFSAFIYIRLRGVLQGAWHSLWPLGHLFLLCMIIAGFVIGADRQGPIAKVSGQRAAICFLVVGCLDSFLCVVVLLMGAKAVVSQIVFVRQA